MKPGRLRRFLIISVALVTVLVLGIIAVNVWIVQSVQSQVFDSVEKVPEKPVALVLGTSKYTGKGYSNLYFLHRIEAAAQLYHKGKVKHIIVSGDNSIKSYNEPRDMKKALMKRGVPGEAITLDYAGFRTLDSVVRAKKVFNQKDVTIISQDFHNYRALFISNFHEMNAVAFNAPSVDAEHSFNVKLREAMARCKAILDLYVLHKSPKYLGEEIDLPVYP